MTGKQEDMTIMGLAMALLAILLSVVALATPNKPHLLVGYGCEGSNGQPMYYTEESDFPPCSLIESAR